MASHADLRAPVRILMNSFHIELARERDSDESDGNNSTSLSEDSPDISGGEAPRQQSEDGPSDEQRDQEECDSDATWMKSTQQLALLLFLLKSKLHLQEEVPYDLPQAPPVLFPVLPF